MLFWLFFQFGDNTPSFGNTPLNAAMGASDEPPKIDPFATTNATEQKLSTIPVAPQSEESIISAITNDTNQLNNPVAPAPSQPIAPIEPAITNPENSIPGFDLPMPPAMPDFGALPPMPPAPTGVDVNGLPLGLIILIKSSFLAVVTGMKLLGNLVVSSLSLPRYKLLLIL
ncbi:hypothetical protein EUA69_03435, partial [TM7 phylum sp. oral taxon 352]